MTTEEDIDWLYDLYLFLRENQDESLFDECTIGWEQDKMVVRVSCLKRALKTFFAMIKCHEHMRKMLPKDIVFADEEH